MVDLPRYVLTPDYGAPPALRRSIMLDFAEFVAITKYDRKGARECAT